jgi:hypothetical protein
MTELLRRETGVLGHTLTRRLRSGSCPLRATAQEVEQPRTILVKHGR